MRKRLSYSLFVFWASFALALSGCAVRRNADSVDVGTMEISGEDVNANTEGTSYLVEWPGVELEAVTQAFLGLSVAQAQPYYHYSIYEKDGVELVSANTDHLGVTGDPSMQERVASIGYQDNREGAYDCYSLVTSYMSNWTNGSLRDVYPREELDSCTKEEAVRACWPYAEACGYREEETQVETYAVTLDLLEEKAQKQAALGGYVISAPGPGFEVVTNREMREQEEKGNKEEFERLFALRHSADSRGIPWEKKHEAMILVCQPYLNGRLLDTGAAYESSLVMIYVPAYGRPICVDGYTCCRLSDPLETGKELITKEEAVAQTLILRGYSSAGEIEVGQISLVYELQFIPEAESEQFRAIPCWKVEYTRNGYPARTIIDAVYGDEYECAPY